MATAQPKPPLCFRVYNGDFFSMIEADEATARAYAAKISEESPIHRYELREVPAEVRIAQGSPLANEGGRYERSLAAYQGGREVPVA